MRHRKSGIKLNRTTSHRESMFKNMVTSLFKYDRIQTTDVKAKELRRLADKVITLAKRGDLHARRQVLTIIREKDVVHKLFEEVGQRFSATTSGYTRIVKTGYRAGDAAPMSMIELIAKSDDKKQKKQKDEKTKTKTPKAAADQSQTKASTSAPKGEPVAQADEAKA